VVVGFEPGSLGLLVIPETELKSQYSFSVKRMEKNRIINEALSATRWQYQSQV
jgi:hypothetical protein